MLDLIIKNGTIIDGTNKPNFKSDIGIKNNVIQEIGNLDDIPAKKIIDASNLVVAPGFIDTDMTSSLAETQVDSLLAQIPLRRLGTPEEIASVVRFLVSEKANYITGETIHVNGGMYFS